MFLNLINPALLFMSRPAEFESIKQNCKIENILKRQKC